MRSAEKCVGVADGTRTHDDQNHNLGLYQLSYSHHRGDAHASRAAVKTGLPGGT